MIDIVRQTPEFVKAARRIATKSAARVQPDGSSSSPDVIDLAESFPEVELIGNGVESVVLVFPGNEKKVVSYSLSTTRLVFEFKEMYYSHRILHTVFPHNFPQIYMAGKLNDGTAVSVRERVINPDGKNKSSFQQISGLIKDAFNEPKPVVTTRFFQKVIDLLRKHGFYTSKYDGYPGNRFTTPDGREMYVDLMQFDEDVVIRRTLEDFAALLDDPDFDDYRGRELSAQEKRACMASFLRLKVLKIAKMICIQIKVIGTIDTYEALTNEVAENIDLLVDKNTTLLEGKRQKLIQTVLALVHKDPEIRSKPHWRTILKKAEQRS